MEKFGAVAVDPSVRPIEGNIAVKQERTFFRSLNWGAILGGTIVAMGIHALLSALGVGLSLSTFEPITDANPIAQLSVVSAVLWNLAALIALLSGGFLAGRFAHSVQTGGVHGVIVWSLTLLITLAMFSVGTGMALGGALKVLGSGLGIGGTVVAAGAGDLAKEGVKRTADQLNSFVDEGVQSAPTGATPQAATKAKREIGFAVAKLFAPGSDIASLENRTAVTTALTQNTGMSETDAIKQVNDWTASYTQLKAELDHLAALAAQKAKEVSDLAGKRLSAVSIWSFFALLLGLIVAYFGGILGARSSFRHVNTETVAVR